MKRDSIALIIGCALLAIAGALAVAGPISSQGAPTPQRSTIPDVVTSIRESLADTPPNQRRIIAGTSAALAQWLHNDPPQTTGEIATIARRSYQIGGWKTGSVSGFSTAFRQAFTDNNLQHDGPLTPERAAKATQILDSIAKGAQ